VIVVDVGCAPQGSEESIPQLIDRFNPSVLFGFDPHPKTIEGTEQIGGTTVITRQAAMWTSRGRVRLAIPEDARCTGITDSPDGVEVDAVDFVDFLEALPPGEVVVKLDCEGAEYPLLTYLAERGADSRLQLLVVEWHHGGFARGWETDKPALSCPVEEWTG
jgi:FkbM family methyltransferase